MQVSNEQILAAAVGKAIAENVTPELTAAVFAQAFKAFMEKPVSNYGNDKTTMAQQTLQDALKSVLTKHAVAFLEQPEQLAVIESITAECFQSLIVSGQLQAACRSACQRMFDNVTLR